MDSRDLVGRYGSLQASFDEKRMTLTFDIDDETEGSEMLLPAVYAVCSLCNGRGKHVNPSIDSHGLTSEDFEDRDFAEAYASGVYDVDCYLCGGRRVEPVVNRDQLLLSEEGKRQLELLCELEKDNADCIRQMEAERRNGA